MRWTVPAVGIFFALAFPACREQSTSSVAVQVTVGDGHACAAFEDGSARCWGEGRRTGQRGDGVLLSAFPRDWLGAYELRPKPEKVGLPKPNQVINLTGAVEIAAGSGHTCARRKDGTVWCWGDNSVGQLGVKDSNRSYQQLPYPVRAVGVTEAVQIAVGSRHSCARRADGSVWCWGGGSYEGQLGRDEEGRAPGPVPGIANAVELRAAENLSCARVASGAVLCWGENDLGQRGNGTAGDRPVVAEPTTLAQRSAVELSVGGEHVCVRASSGSVTCWGSNSSGRRDVPADLPLQTVTAGPENTCGVTAAGAFWCWGRAALFKQLLPAKAFEAMRSGKAQIGTVSGVKQLAVGTEHICFRLDSGAVQCWGSSWRDTATKRNDASQGPFVIEGLIQAIDVAANRTRSCAVAKDGSVACWGSVQKLEPVNGISDAAQVCLGKEHGCVRLAGGTVMCWGVGDRGQLGRGRTAKNETLGPAPVPGLAGVEQVVASDYATCARTTGGLVRCWGSNQDGELGEGVFSREGPKSAIGHPVAVRLTLPAVDVQGGGSSFCARLSDGSIACWGSNEFGQILSKDEKRGGKAPSAVVGVKSGVQIAVAGQHACVRVTGGRVLCWGSNVDGQMGEGTWGRGNLRVKPAEVPALAGSTEVLVSGNATCGRMRDGRLRCVGGGGGALWEIPGLQAATQIALIPGPSQKVRSENGQPDRPSGCAVMSNGALACWGDLVPRASEQQPTMGPPVQVRW